MTILDLVNKLIGSVLQGNIYTNTDPYNAKVLQRPTNADHHIPGVDPRPLNFPEANIHPHSNIAGPGGEANSKNFVIPTTPNGMHDNYGAFNDPATGVTPGGKRGEIYQPGGHIPKSVHQQAESISANAPPPPGPAIFSPSGQLATSKGTGDDYTIRRMKRDEIYAQSYSGNRKLPGPIADLLDFHDSQIPSEPPPEANPPGYVNKSGMHPAEIGEMERDIIYQKSDHLNRSDRQISNMHGEHVGDLKDSDRGGDFISTPHPHYDSKDSSITSKVMPTPGTPPIVG
jgi:hypothetical protein